MNKKTLGRIAAASLAAMTAVSAMGVSASAMVGTGGVASGSIYQVTITETNSAGVTSTTTKYYTNETTANAAINGLGQGVAVTKSETTVNSIFGNGTVIYVSPNGEITRNNTAGDKYTVSGSSSGTSSGTSSSNGVSYPYQSTTYKVYYGSNGKWYPNLGSLYAAGATYVSEKNSGYNATSGYIYFNVVDGYYTNTPSDQTVTIVGTSTAYDNYNHHDYDTYDVYRVNGTYYPTLSAALAAAANNYSLITKVADYSRPQTNYFSKTTGKYYSTYSAALAASGNSASNVHVFNYYSDNYYNGYYDGYYYGYGDPYYYYWLQKQNSKDDTTSTSNDTTTATVGNRKGWTAISKYLSSLKNGSSVSVSMNYETTIPSTVTSAIKGRNITVKFVLKNGVVFTINGNDISTASSIDIDTTYNTSMIPTKLIKAAYKKNDAVSNAQITISNGSFGADADVTVKFATKRAGCTAKLYRYNSAKETLSLVSTAKVQSTGKCTFGDVDKGGNFVIILC